MTGLGAAIIVSAITGGLLYSMTGLGAAIIVSAIVGGLLYLMIAG